MGAIWGPVLGRFAVRRGGALEKVVFAATAVVVAACSDDAATGTGPIDEGEPLVPAPRCEAPGDGPERDLVDVARLRSEGTAPTVLTWPREDRDELTTIRDDRADTGWKPVAEGGARAEIDLGPAGGPFALRSLELAWDAPPAAVEVHVRDACGGGLVARHTWRGEPVALGDVCGACVELVVRDAGAARLVRASLGSAAPNAPEPAPLPAPAPSATPLPRFGVVEGFYGVPWTWTERERLVDTLARAGLGLYVYAPKDDPLHRARWRDPYDAEFIDAFAALAARAEERGVRVAMAVSPFIDFDPDAGDHARIVDKLRPFVEAGAGGVALFADDIEFETDRPIDGALGAQHAAEIDAVAAELRAMRPELDVFFVGTVYSDARLAQWPEAQAYLAALGTVDPSVVVLWTGSDTFAPTIDVAGLATASDPVGRTVGVWDNHWANDAGNGFFGRVLLAPLTGRAGDLVGGTPAFVQNPSVEGALARLQAGMFGAWYAGPQSMGDEQRAFAAELEGANASTSSPSDAAADRSALVRRAIDLFESSGIAETSGDVELAGLLESIASALAAGGPVEPALVDDVLRRVARARTARSELERSGVAVDLVDDLREPLEKVEAAAGLVLDALERAAAAKAGEPTGSLDGVLSEGPVALDAVSRFRFLDDVVVDLVSIAASVPRGAGPSRPALADPGPDCVVGEPFAWKPFAAADRVEAIGVDNAMVEEGVVRFTPRVAARHELVALALPSGPEGSWSSVRATLVCRPPTP